MVAIRSGGRGCGGGQSLASLWLVLVVFSVCAVVRVQSQVDGSFWWTNKDLLEKARENRENKKVDFKEESAAEKEDKFSVNGSPTTVAGGGLDCTCMSKCRCLVAIENATTTASSTNRRLCPVNDQVCCHIIKLPIPRICFEMEQTTTTTSTTTQKTTTTTTTATTTTDSSRLSFEGNFAYPDDERLVQSSFLLKLFLREKRRPRVPKRICGAALLTRTSAITAQHCVRGSRFSQDFMIVTSDGQPRVVTEIIRHPDYYSGGLHNDLAILKWDDDVRITDQVDVVDLPLGANTGGSHSHNNSAYENCSFVAFGSDDRGFEFDVDSEEAQLLERSTCERKIQASKWGPRFTLHHKFTCIEPNHNRPSCNPSATSLRSGNPLVCYERGDNKSRNRHPVLIGIMSWYSCQKSHPDVLVDVRENLQWINDSKEFYSY